MCIRIGQSKLFRSFEVIENYNKVKQGSDNDLKLLMLMYNQVLEYSIIEEEQQRELERKYKR